MSKLVYAPAGAERQEWPFDLDNLTVGQFVLIEDTLGITTQEWSDALDKGAMKAMAALAWVLRRDSEPDLTWDAVMEMKVGALSVEDEPEPPKDEGSATP